MIIVGVGNADFSTMEYSLFTLKSDSSKLALIARISSETHESGVFQKILLSDLSVKRLYRMWISQTRTKSQAQLTTLVDPGRILTLAQEVIASGTNNTSADSIK